MRVRRNSTQKDFIGSFIIQQRTRQPINKIDCCKDAVSPELQRQIGLKPKGSSNTQYMLVLPFYN